MTSLELTKATTALRAWFISQDIAPADACMCMVKIIAEQMVAKSRQITYLNESIVAHQNLLTLEVAECLHQPPPTNNLIS